MSDFTSGRHAKFSFRQNNIPIIILCKSQNLQELADESEDDVCGEERSRFQTLTKGFKVDIQMFHENMVTLDAQLADIANTDAGAAAFVKSMGIKFTLLDATRAAYALSQGTRGAFKFDVSGMNQRNMISTSYRFRYFKKI